MAWKITFPSDIWMLEEDIIERSYYFIHSLKHTEQDIIIKYIYLLQKAHSFTGCNNLHILYIYLYIAYALVAFSMHKEYSFHNLHSYNTVITVVANCLTIDY